jgi:hypothetical protein
VFGKTIVVGFFVVVLVLVIRHTSHLSLLNSMAQSSSHVMMDQIDLL